MGKHEKLILTILRMIIGWLFLYAGLTKLGNPEWTAAGFLKGAKTFPALYHWLGSEANIGWVDFLNQWGLTFVGAGMITGFLTRIAALGGVLIMALYYLPRLDFPYLENAFLVDQHVIYALVFALMFATRAGQYWGLDKYLKTKKKHWYL